MENKLVLSNNLKRIRIEKKISQSALACMVGVSRNTISSIEVGQFSPTAKLAYSLCIALDKKFEEVFFFENFAPKEVALPAPEAVENDESTLTDRTIQRMKEYLSGAGWSAEQILDFLMFLIK